MARKLMEQKTRVAMLASIGFIGLAVVSLKAETLPMSSGRAEAGTNAYSVEIAQGCGPGLHWVGKHRNRYDGAWVPGHCARN
jgi:hypothetical protein